MLPWMELTISLLFYSITLVFMINMDTVQVSLVEGERGIIELDEIGKRINFVLDPKQTKYEIIDNNEDVKFFIKNDNLNLESQQIIDREKILKCRSQSTCNVEFQLLFQAPSEIAGKLIVFNVEIIDINDSPPRFIESVVEMNIPENVESVSYRVIGLAIDDDSPKNGVNISNGGYKLEENFGKFSLKPTSDSLHLVVDKSLDREIKDRYELRIYATDGKFKTWLNVIITVSDANDNQPIFDASKYEKSISIKDLVIDESIIRVNAYDIDKGLNAQITYRLLKTTSNSEKFFIDSNTGEIRLNSLVNDPTIIELIVEATDGGSPSRRSQTTVIIKVEAAVNPPRIIINKIAENKETPGIAEIDEESDKEQFICHLTVVDGDKFSNTNYDVKCTIDNSRFKLISDRNDNDDGQPDRKDFMITTQFKYDREVISKDEVKITCSDKNLHSSTSVEVWIKDLNDNRPLFKKRIYERNITENNDETVSVLQVAANDLDVNQNAEISYSIDDRNINDNMISSVFYINDKTGQIYSYKELDREVKDHYEFTVRATDNGYPIKLTDTASVIINIIDENDEKPIFEKNQYEFTIFENQPIRTFIGTVKATDADLNDEPYYSILDFQLTMKFSVNNKTGDLYSLDKFDREKRNLYTFYLKASSQRDRTQFDTAKIQIRILDLNDNFPRFNLFTIPQPFLVSSHTPVNHQLFTVSAIDDDEDLNAKLTYQLGTTNLCNYFAINSSSGTVFIRRDLSAVRFLNCSLYVIVQDSGLNVKRNNSEYIFLSINSSLPFTDNTLSGQTSDSNQSPISVTVIIIVVVTSALVITFLIVAITVLLRRRMLSNGKRKKGKKESEPKLQIMPMNHSLDSPESCNHKETMYLTTDTIDRNNTSGRVSFDKNQSTINMSYNPANYNNLNYNNPNDIYLCAHQLAVKERDTDSGRGSYEEGENRCGTLNTENDSPNSKDSSKSSIDYLSKLPPPPLSILENNPHPPSRRVTFKDQRHPLYSIHEETYTHPQQNQSDRHCSGVSLV